MIIKGFELVTIELSLWVTEQRNLTSHVTKITLISRYKNREQNLKIGDVWFLLLKIVFYSKKQGE